MARIIKTGPDAYFINNDGSISMKYDEYLNKSFKLNDKEIPMKAIYIQEGGQIVFMDNGEKVVIDDGYRTTLIAAGYLDCSSPEEFKVVKEKIKGFMVSKAGYIYLGVFEPINKMIGRNMLRKKKQLPLYPSIRDKDKQLSLYFRIYATKEDSLTSAMKSKQQLRELGLRLLTDYIDMYNCTIDECAIEKTILKYEDDL